MIKTSPSTFDGITEPGLLFRSMATNRRNAISRKQVIEALLRSGYLPLHGRARLWRILLSLEASQARYPAAFRVAHSAIASSPLSLPIWHDIIILYALLQEENKANVNDTPHRLHLQKVFAAAGIAVEPVVASWLSFL